MPDPYAVGSSIVGGSLELYGGLAAASAARRQAAYQAALLEQNAQLLDYASADAIARGRYAEGVQRLQTGRKLASQTTAYAASGVDVASGSATDVEGSTALLGELDAQVIRANARREAWGYGVQAQQARFGAKIARATGDAKYAEDVLAGVSGAARYAVPMLRISGAADSGWSATDESWAATPFGSDIQGGT